LTFEKHLQRFPDFRSFCLTNAPFRPQCFGQFKLIHLPLIAAGSCCCCCCCRWWLLLLVFGLLSSKFTSSRPRARQSCRVCCCMLLLLLLLLLMLLLWRQYMQPNCMQCTMHLSKMWQMQWVMSELKSRMGDRELGYGDSRKERKMRGRNEAWQLPVQFAFCISHRALSNGHPRQMGNGFLMATMWVKSSSGIAL